MNKSVNKTTPSSAITPASVKHIANLAHIPVTAVEEQKLAAGFSATLEVVDQLKSVNVTQIEPTHQVTGMENIWRDDVATSDYTFTQAQALQNSPQTHQGYFVVPRLIDQD